MKFSIYLNKRVYEMIISKWEVITQNACQNSRGWFGVAKVSCILRNRGVQLRLAYSWARPAILVAGKGRWGMF